MKQTHLKVKDDKDKIGKELRMEKDKESRLKDEISKLQEVHEQQRLELEKKDSKSKKDKETIAKHLEAIRSHKQSNQDK